MKINELNEEPLGEVLTPGRFPTEKQLLTIQRDCRKILWVYAQHPGKFFYRGSFNEKKNLDADFNKRSVDDRWVKDTPQKWHYKVVDLMQELRFPAHRGNSIFVTSSNMVAAEYGSSTYMIFPVDGFHYTWSPKVADFYSDFYGMDEEEFYKSVANEKEFMKAYDYRADRGLEQALESGNEVMIAGKYYRLPMVYTLNREVGTGYMIRRNEGNASLPAFMTKWIKDIM